MNEHPGGLGPEHFRITDEQALARVIPSPARQDRLALELAGTLPPRDHPDAVLAGAKAGQTAERLLAVEYQGKPDQPGHSLLQLAALGLLRRALAVPADQAERQRRIARASAEEAAKPLPDDLPPEKLN